jgi:hypothetical protein
MSYQRLKKPQDVLEEGQDIDVKIIDLRPEERRMVLSIKALGGSPELRPGATLEEEFRKPRGGAGAKGGRRRPDDSSDDARRGIATGGATIGERLGALKGLLKSSPEDSE